MSDATPRILATHLENFKHQNVRILGKVTQLRGEHAQIDAGGLITILLGRVSFVPFQQFPALSTPCILRFAGLWVWRSGTETMFRFTWVTVRRTLISRSIMLSRLSEKCSKIWQSGSLRARILVQGLVSLFLFSSLPLSSTFLFLGPLLEDSDFRFFTPHFSVNFCFTVWLH